jgi:hypothetical protein
MFSITLEKSFRPRKPKLGALGDTKKHENSQKIH